MQAPYVFLLQEVQRYLHTDDMITFVHSIYVAYYAYKRKLYLILVNKIF